MKIVESNVQLKCEREASSRVEIKGRFTQSFSQVLASQEKAQESRERLVKMLESLVEAILAAMEGKSCRSNLNYRQQPMAKGDGEKFGGRKIEWRSELSTTRFETEHTTVTGDGMIRTADGRCIRFDLCMDMERSVQTEEHDVQGGTIALKDPLVINFDGSGAALSSQRITFDLDADGEDERIPGLRSGSGYLVFDRNRNGQADDGTELFGAISGDGFADLAALDSNRNGWLDEDDASFKDLFVWNGGQGSGSLVDLQSADVGALWTGSVVSPFALKDSAGKLLGEIRGTGVWLRESSGLPSALQQVDLASENPETSYLKPA